MGDYLKPYQQGVSDFGTDFEVTLWASVRSQQLRFRVMAELVAMKDKRVLDAGCSRGDLATWLLDHGVQYSQYIGVDAIGPVIDFAKTRQIPRSQFVAGDFVTQPGLLKTGDPQVICISGSLNTMDDLQVFAVLEAAWNATGESLVFNFLSDRAGPAAPPQDKIARRLSPMALIDWALEKTSNVIFRQDYFAHGHDATIRMKRDR